MGARVRVLGSSQIDGVERLGRRDRVVLAALVVSRAPVPADRLAEALYGEEPTPTWRKAVQGSVTRLRQSLGARAVETTPAGYWLTVGDDDIDARRFEDLYQRAVELIEVGQAARALPMLREALALFAGEPLPDLDGWGPGRDEAARLLELRRQAEERLVEALLAEGRLDEAVTAGVTLARREPLREQRWVLLAQALYRADRQADALRAIDRARRLLRDELGVDPGPALVAVQRAVLQHDPSLGSRDAHALVGTPTCPYKGLAAYDVEDADSFFGRGEDIELCVTHLLRVGLLAIVGPSGSGKSSLARAGVVPAVRRRGQAIFVITPGANPVERLARVPTDAAVVVDQLEELFTISTDPAERQAFAQALVRRTVRVPVTVTLRADFVAAVSTVPALAHIVQSGLYLLGPMSEVQIRAAIEEPATRAGLRLEPGLVDLLVREVEGQSGALPLLSHALVETWSRRTDRILTVAGYRAGGGVQGAVAATADQVVDHLPPEGRRIARSVFLRLISLSDAGAPIRHRLRRADLAHDERSMQVVDALMTARLLTADAETIEVAHEALGRAWPRLRTWLEEDRDGQRLFRHLAVSATEWERTGRDSAELYRGARLRAAEEWVAGTSPELTPTERAFLDQSVALRQAEEHDLAVHAETQHRTNRRLRWSLAAVATLLVGALVATLLAVTQQRRAEREEREAALQALVSRSSALRSTRRDLAALLAVEAYRLAPGPDTESALFGTFTASPGVQRVVHLDAGRFHVGAIMSDGDVAALVDERGSVHLVDLARGAVTAVLESRHADEAVAYVAGSPEGRYLAVGSFRVTPTGEFADETRDELTVWDTRTGQRRFPDVPLPFHPGSVAFSPDGSLVAVGGGDEGRVSVYDAVAGAHRLDVEPVPRPPDAYLLVSTVAVAFAQDGSLIAGSESGPIRIIDPATGRVTRRIDAPPLTAHYLLRVSSGGRSLTTVGVEGVAHYDIATGAALWPEHAPGGCNSLVPAERIGVLLCGEYSGRVTAIDLATGAIVGRRFDSQQGIVGDLLVSPDGTTLLEVMESAPVYVQWRLDGGGPVSRAITEDAAATSVSYLDERLLVATDNSAEATGASDVRIIDPNNGETLDPLAELTMAAPMPDGSRLAAVFTDGTVGAYDLGRRARSGPSVDVGFVPEGITTSGDRALVWSGGRLQAVNLDRAALVGPNIDQGEVAVNLAVVPDSSHLLTLDGFYSLLQRRDPDSGEPLGEAIPDYNLLSAAGGIVVASTSDGRLVVLDPGSLTAVGAPLPPITGPAKAIALSADGRRLAVLGEDRALRFYDVASRIQLGDEIPVAGDGGAVAISGDGLEAAVATDQGLVMWDLNPDRWIEGACGLAGRNLSAAEWDFHLGDLARYRRTCPDHPNG